MAENRYIPDNYLHLVLNREEQMERTNDQRQSMTTSAITVKHDCAGKRVLNSFVKSLSEVGKDFRLFVKSWKYDASVFSYLIFVSSTIL